MDPFNPNTINSNQFLGSMDSCAVYSRVVKILENGALDLASKFEVFSRVTLEKSLNLHQSISYIAKTLLGLEPALVCSRTQALSDCSNENATNKYFSYLVNIHINNLRI